MSSSDVIAEAHELLLQPSNPNEPVLDLPFEWPPGIQARLHESSWDRPGEALCSFPSEFQQKRDLLLVKGGVSMLGLVRNVLHASFSQPVSAPVGGAKVSTNETWHKARSVRLSSGLFDKGEKQ